MFVKKQKNSKSAGLANKNGDFSQSFQTLQYFIITVFCNKSHDELFRVIFRKLRRVISGFWLVESQIRNFNSGEDQDVFRDGHFSL